MLASCMSSPTKVDADSIDSLTSVYCHEEIEETAIKNLEPRQERYRSNVIPRPALTSRGVVFSYQPYEIGCYADGDIHFVLPYAEIKDLLNPEMSK